MTRPTSTIVVAVVYGSRRYGLAILSGEHLYRAEVRRLHRAPDAAKHFERQLEVLLERYDPHLFCEVVSGDRTGGLQRFARPIIERTTAATGRELVTVTRARLRAQLRAPPERASNDAVGRAVLRDYPELAARYGAPEILGRASHPTSRERYLYLLFLAVAGARVGLYSTII